MTAFGKVATLTDLEKSDKYQRALSLNFDCGSDTLRKLIEKMLNDSGKTFKGYVKDSVIQSKIQQLKQRNVLYIEQVRMINCKDPDIECMDISLLTVMLLDLFPVTSNQKDNIKKLRKKRNELAHKPRSMLEDDVPFNEASQIIIDLAKDTCKAFEDDISKRIEELKKRELIRTRSNLEVIQLNNESLMVKLVEAGKNETVDGNNEIWIKLGLTKYVRQLARCLEVDALLQDLKSQGVVSDMVKRKIEQMYNYEEQMQVLVLHMMDETRENLLKFCDCVRRRNSLLADLVLHQSTDEKKIGTKLHEEEISKLQEIIQASFLRNKKKSIACEDVHIFVESQRKCLTAFQKIQDCIVECFPDVKFEENDSRFHGIDWKDERESQSNDKLIEERVDSIEIREKRLDSHARDIKNTSYASSKKEEEVVLTDLPCDKFGTYLAKEMEGIKEGLGRFFEEMATQECISAKIFSRLSTDQMQEIFGRRLKEEGLNFGFGIKSSLSEMQKKIKHQLNRHSVEENARLRKFDTPTENLTYTKCTVKPSAGNLLTPAHVFVCPVVKNQDNTAFMAKEVIRFALACINGKKNGTIHFGMKEGVCGAADIVGLPTVKVCNAKQLDEEISSSIQVCCDRRNRFVVARCIRPVQAIPVEDDFIVLEVDIVPFSGHIKDPCILIKYPPKGFQREKCFLFKENTINTIENSKYESVSTDFVQLLNERTLLEMNSALPNTDITSKVSKKLTRLLTGGNKYVTDAFIPIICSGDMSACRDEVGICNHLLSMATAFTSAAAIFDFNSSVELRNGVERGNIYFLVKMAEDYSTKRLRRESDLVRDSTIWLYSNGNKELGKDKMISEMWYENRLGGVKNALQHFRQEIPFKRGLVIFLVFQKTIEYDPMLEIAREAFLTTFKDECIVIAENEDMLVEWRKEMRGKITKQDFEGKIVTGLSWEEISVIFQSVFKPHKDVLYKFPDSKGRIIEMTSREKDEMQLQDIELVDGNAEEHCRLQEEDETDENCRLQRSNEQEQFYKGNKVTWWNFYYSTQVGKRDAYDSHLKFIKEKLTSNDSRDRYENHVIEHHPGAGGTTVAFHLLWRFSQITRNPADAYRCCIVKRISDRTAEEVYQFQVFKEKDISEAKPVIVLVDNESEEHVNVLKAKVDEIAYKKGSPGKLFCLLMCVTRVPVSHISSNKIVEHNLSKREKMWFQQKFEELQNSSGVKVNTLIAFNVMRSSFDRQVIEEITQRLVNETNDKERQLLGYLSVICSFDSDNPVPEPVFDSVMLNKTYDLNTLTLAECINRPFGIVASEKERRAMQKNERETWNVNLSDAMQLLITHRLINRDTYSFNGVCILSQPLAKAVMKYIMNISNKSFQDMTMGLLEHVKQHSIETNQMSKHFVQIVCSLFTCRESFTDKKGENKVAKFSPLILRLEEQQENESAEEASKRVVDVFTNCFTITKNAMVGQQLTRFYIHIKEYEAAEQTVQQCLKLVPNNSYLLDTYGQIYKTKMELHFVGRTNRKMKDADAVECIDLAFKAVEKFRLAQKASTFNDVNTTLNSNSFNMEVTTVLCLLENFSCFECFEEESFWAFLNDSEFCIETSSYKGIMQKSQSLKEFRKGSEFQLHVENSLRTLEERAYMTRELTPVVIPSRDVLLLRPREKYEMFYGSEEHTSQFKFLYGVGFKLLMSAYDKEDDKPKLERRVEEAEFRIRNGETVEIERDLLVFIGYNIITISNQQQNAPNLRLYRQLVNYSTRLYDIQRKKGTKERRFVEAYLYYALLHWILPERASSGIENLSHPDVYKSLLSEWKEVYMQNNLIKSEDQLSKVTPKIYFALGCGDPGNDIVDLECLRKLWRKDMLRLGRKKKEVKTDKHWYHPIFEERLHRLSGTVESNGKAITTEVQYKHKEYTFKIPTLENFGMLSNRSATFVLGFSWMGLVALDVRKADKTFRRQTSGNSYGVTSDNLSKNVDQYRQLTRSTEGYHQRLEKKEFDQEPALQETDIRGNISRTSSVTERLKAEDSITAFSNLKRTVDAKVVISERKESGEIDSLFAGPSRFLRTTGNNRCDIKPSQSVSKNGRSHDMRAEIEMHPANDIKNWQTMDWSGTVRPKDGSTNSHGIKGKAIAENKGRGIGRGRGRGRGLETVFQKTRNAPRVGNVKSAEGQMDSAVVPEEQTTNIVPAQAPEPSMQTLVSHQMPNDQIDNAGEDSWQEVRSKKKLHASQKELPVVKTKESTSVTPKQNFEDLLIKCQHTFPGVPRNSIIDAYNKVKAKHGSLKGFNRERIIKEIGIELGKTH